MNFLSALLSLNSPARQRVSAKLTTVKLTKLIAATAAVAIMATACGGGTTEIGTDTGTSTDQTGSSDFRWVEGRE